MLFGKTKQAYYQYDENLVLRRTAIRSFAKEYALSVRKEDPGMGMGKIWYMYQKEFRYSNEILGRDAFTDLLVESGMQIRNVKRSPKTTDSSHGLPLFPNLIKDFIPTGPNQLWVSDITYISITDRLNNYRFCYLSMIVDAYSEEIIGWNIGDSLKMENALQALEMALSGIKGMDVNLIHHSDRGAQYASSCYVKMLQDRNIRVSMTESGNPKDNAQAERINNTIKNEFLKGRIFYSIDEVNAAVSSVVDFYNNKRPHMSIDMMTPSEASFMNGELNKRWKSYRDIAIKAKNMNVSTTFDITKISLPLQNNG